MGCKERLELSRFGAACQSIAAADERTRTNAAGEFGLFLQSSRCQKTMAAAAA